MKLFNRRLAWYREKYFDYKYALGRGEMFFNEIESVLSVGSQIGIFLILLGIKSRPIILLVSIGLGLRLMKVILGEIDKRYLKFGQAESEYLIRKRLIPAGNEMFDKINDIHNVVCPDKKDKKWETYIGTDYEEYYGKD